MFSTAEKDRRIAAAEKRVVAADERFGRYETKAKAAAEEGDAAKKELAWLKQMPTEASPPLFNE
jgi:hypothetical protein